MSLLLGQDSKERREGPEAGPSHGTAPIPIEGKVEEQNAKCSPTITTSSPTPKRPIQSGRANPPRDVMTEGSHRGFKGAAEGGSWISF